MENIKEIVITNILSEIQNNGNIKIEDIKNILEQNLDNYTLTPKNINTDQSDIIEKIKLFISVRTLDGLSTLTVKTYLDELMFFKRYVDKPVVDININDLRMYFYNIQKERKYENTTINNKMNVIKTFFTFLYDEEIIPKNPSIKLKCLKVDNKSLREALTIEELETLRNVCLNSKEKTMIEFLLSTGCRVSEALKVKLSEINWSDNSIVVNGKGNKDRRVYFSVKCKIYIKKYLSERKGDSDSLFIGDRSPYELLTKSGLERAVTRIAKRTNITKSVSPHVLRHTFATLFLQRGMDIQIIQQLMGHSSIGTTQIYAETNERMIKSAYEQFVAA